MMIEYMYGKKRVEGIVMKKKYMAILILCLLGSNCFLAACGVNLEATIPPSQMKMQKQEMLHNDSVEKVEEVAVIQIQPVSTPQPPPLVTATPTPVLQDVVTITISAAGDCSLGNHQQQDYSLSFNQAYEQEGGPEYFFQNVKEIFAADDMTIVNLEGVLTESDNAEPGRAYNIKGHPSYAGILTSGSVEAVSMGNNHRQDYGQQGTKDTEAALDVEGILYAYDKNVAIYENKGIRIGYLSVNEIAWGYGVEDLITEGIEKLKAENVDLLFVACHWGTEREYYPEAYQLQLGKKCIDMGADLVIGHHPHVLQGIEEYKGKIILHSLGNFCFGANRSPSDKDTMIYQQTFTFVDGEKQDTLDAKVIPCSISSVDNRNNFQPTPLQGEERLRVIEKLNTYSADLGITVSKEGKVEKQ